MARKTPKTQAEQPQDRAPVERDVAGRFTTSGNPGGQPKWVKEIRDALATRCVPLAEKALHDVLSGKDKSAKASDRIQAADVVYRYVLPKPKQEVEVSAPQGQTTAVFAGLTAEQLVEIAKGGK